MILQILQLKTNFCIYLGVNIIPVDKCVDVWGIYVITVNNWKFSITLSRSCSDIQSTFSWYISEMCNYSKYVRHFDQKYFLL